MSSRELIARRAREVSASRLPDVPSPCISVCRMDPVTQYCEGCFRTLDEIAAWGRMEDAGKREVWRLIGQRALAPAVSQGNDAQDRALPGAPEQDGRAQSSQRTAGKNMKQITFYLDFVSPFAYLAFEKLPEALLGLSYAVDYRPVLFAGMLKHHGQLGPAEIGPKRDWTYRQVLWLAHTQGIPLQMSAAHPFNPLALLRLALACDARVANRYVCETIFRHVWRGGADAADTQRLAALTQALQPRRDPAGDDVKADLKANTEEAIARGLFGVPTCAVDDKLFWGFDALSMLRAYLEGDAWFASGAWEAAQRLPVGVARAGRG